MISGSAGANVRNPLDTLFRFGVVGDLSDGQLIQRFLTARDGAEQAAFSTLVERHGPMVLRVCRQILGDSHDAQDAFQATFLVLVRKAGSLRDADSLASWLYGVATRVAARAKLDATRRRVFERRSATSKAVKRHREGGPTESWPELHEEIARLPAHYREPVVLCYLEGLTTVDASMRIGCPQGTVLSRLSRARERLRDRLERRGLAFSLASLNGKFTTPTTAELPAALLQETVHLSLGFAGRQAAEAALASATATTLARGVLYTMTFSKLKILGAAILTCAFAIGGVQTFGKLGGLRGDPKPDSTYRDDDDPQDTMTRSVEKIQTGLEETARRNADMRKELQGLRDSLKAIRPAPESAKDKGGIDRLAEMLRPHPARDAVARFADALKRHPPRRGPVEGERHQLYMMDLLEGGTTLIVDEPAPDLIWNGAARWSHDGNRILFDATPGTNWQLSRLMSIEIQDGRPRFTDLGPGNCATLSPDDKRIAFLLNHGASRARRPGYG